MARPQWLSRPARPRPPSPRAPTFDAGAGAAMPKLSTGCRPPGPFGPDLWAIGCLSWPRRTRTPVPAPSAPASRAAGEGRERVLAEPRPRLPLSPARQGYHPPPPTLCSLHRGWPWSPASLLDHGGNARPPSEAGGVKATGDLRRPEGPNHSELQTGAPLTGPCPQGHTTASSQPGGLLPTRDTRPHGSHTQ